MTKAAVCKLAGINARYIIQFFVYYAVTVQLYLLIYNSKGIVFSIREMERKQLCAKHSKRT